MRTVYDYLQDVIKVKNGIDAETVRILSNNKQKILDLNRQNQLYEKGINSDGGLLQGYSSFTIAIKRQKGEVYNRTTLLDKGSFYDNFDYLFRQNRLKIFSRDSKTGKLQDKYGENIFGLTDENVQIFNYDIVLPELMKYILKYL